MMDVERDEGGGTGSARRRRERRLRSMLRHERMAVAMAVAEATHHSLLMRTEVCHSHQGGGGARDALRPTGAEDSTYGRAARHPCGAQAAEERQQPAALCGGLPPDPWSACAGRRVGSRCGRLHVALPHCFGAPRQRKRASAAEERGPGEEEQAVEEEEKEEEEEEASESLLFTFATCSSRGSHSEIWTSFLLLFLLFGVWVLPFESWVIGCLGDVFHDVSVFSAWSDGFTPMRQSARHLEDFFVGILRPLVSGSRLFYTVRA